MGNSLQGFNGVVKRKDTKCEGDVYIWRQHDEIHLTLFEREDRDYIGGFELVQGMLYTHMELPQWISLMLLMYDKSKNII
jgi:hypothetical protein